MVLILRRSGNSVRDQISENNCDVVCLQETKRSHIDISFLHNFCSPQYDCFEFLPSNGASRGIVIFFGKALSSLDPSSSRMILLFLCSLLQFIIMLHGF